VTGGKVEARIANAEHDATYLLSKIDVVATYKLAGINRTRMENLFHKLFASARLNITIDDRFGNPVIPREWFLVPLFVVDEAVERIKDGAIANASRTGLLRSTPTTRRPGALRRLQLLSGDPDLAPQGHCTRLNAMGSHAKNSRLET